MNRIQAPLTINRRASIAAAVFTSVLLFGGFANAGTMPSAHSRRAKTGHLTITSPTEVAGTTLQPGEYDVRQSNSTNGPVIEFVHKFRNELASELVQADEEEVAARVQFTEQPLRSPLKHTQLVLASNADAASGLQIRGNIVSYEFAPSQMAGKSEASVICSN
jgi:hypothetical protein